MENQVAIEVKNVTKSFKVYYDKGKELKEKMLFWKRNKFENRVVLDDVSFTIKRGEAVGLVGKNGCGKSTTLNMLTRIIYPDSGSITMHGRVSSLIELGAGFHPDMTGRENIYTNASIFGLTKKEIDARLDDIISFSELGQYIDNPVRTYSSGMYMRLAFSVAINVDADILLVDEILAVGDANFQTKCFNKIREIKGQGTTIVIVSHSLGQIEQICDRSIWIKDGRIEKEGDPKSVHLEYLDYMNNERMDEEERARVKQQRIESGLEDENRFGTGNVRCTNVRLLDDNGDEQGIFKCGGNMTVQFDYHVNNPVENAIIGVKINRIDGVYVYGTDTRIDKFKNFEITQDGTISLTFKDMPLIKGQYYLDISIEYSEGLPEDYLKHAAKFEIVSSLEDMGIALVSHDWDISKIR